MGDVYDEFERELLDWRRRYARDPRGEMVRLFLLALEREQLVSVGYRETLIAQRLGALSVSEEAREVMRHALLWAWKDEEIHTIYIRGVLLRLGGPRLKARAFAQQLSGAVAGWAASVRQHLPWRQAPLSNALATALTTFGRLAGKVPRAVRTQLEYGPLRDFCLFQVDAERTAARCWERLAELAGEQPGVPALAGDFRRMKCDEDRHAQVFAVLGAALDGQDRLAEGETADSLAAKLAAAGEFFLPPERRRRAGSPVGRGGAVHVVRGGTAGEKRPLVRRLLQEAGLPESLQERARVRGRPLAELRVAVKPTFMIGYHRADPSPLTDPELVDELAAFLRGCGVADVAVIEAPTIYDRFYRNRSVHEVAAYLGFTSPRYRVVDASQEQAPHEYARGMAQYSVSRTWKEADFRISFAKMRSNPVDAATLSVSNLEGLGPRHDQFFFAERQAHRDTATMMLLDEFPPHFALIDAYDRASDGLLGMMGNPRPKVPRRLYAAADPIALDMVALRHMGIVDPDESGMLEEARHWFGDPRPRTTVVGVDEPIAGWRGPYSDEWSTLLSLLAYSVYQFGSGRGALFVPEMDEQAFPPVEPPGLLLRAGRRAVQTLFGLRLPR
jgi:uncharacterized protein (DUF362 family)